MKFTSICKIVAKLSVLLGLTAFIYVGGVYFVVQLIYPFLP